MNAAPPFPSPPPTSGEISGPPSHGGIPDSTINDAPSHNLIGVTCLLLTLCLIAVGGRFRARGMTKARLGVDDYLSLVALVRG